MRRRKLIAILVSRSAVSWFINIERWQKHLTFTYFDNRFIFGYLLADLLYCNNCHYASITQLRINEDGNNNNG